MKNIYLHGKLKCFCWAVMLAASLIMFGCTNNVAAKPEAGIAGASSGQTGGSGSVQSFDSKEYDVNGVKFTMITIPAVTGVTLGADGQDYNPLHTVTLTAYRIGETEVTQELFEKVMGANPSVFKDSPAEGEEQKNRPVERTNW